MNDIAFTSSINFGRINMDMNIAKNSIANTTDVSVLEQEISLVNESIKSLMQYVEACKLRVEELEAAKNDKKKNHLLTFHFRPMDIGAAFSGHVEPAPKGGVTVVVDTHLVRSKNVIGFGVSVCSTKDNFDKKYGRLIASQNTIWLKFDKDEKPYYDSYYTDRMGFNKSVFRSIYNHLYSLYSKAVYGDKFKEDNNLFLLCEHIINFLDFSSVSDNVVDHNVYVEKITRYALNVVRTRT